MAGATPANEEQRLCLECGLCCDGTLFERVDVRPAELVRSDRNARDNAAVATAQPETWPQPCEHHRLSSAVTARSQQAAGWCCAIYADRPATCAHFRCQLLASLEAGERTYEECRRLVGEVRERQARLRRTLGLPDRSALWRATELKLAEMGALDDREGRRAHADALMGATELRVLCTRAFGAVPSTGAVR